LPKGNLLAPDTKISLYRSCQNTFACYFEKRDSLCFCDDVNGLFSALSMQHNTDDWRLFIDSSKRSLKAVLLHNGNRLPSIPLAHSVHMKETHENMATLLQAISYNSFQWHVSGDLKVVGLLLGLQSGYTKYCCFLCLWDSRDRCQHYIKKNWPTRDSMIPGTHNVKYQPLIDSPKIYLPPLHIKLDLMKNFAQRRDSFRIFEDKISNNK
jgi:hypothetical protein